MKGKDEREAAREAALADFRTWVGVDDVIAPAFGIGYDKGYDAGLAARPEPPEPDGDLVEAERRRIAHGIQEILNRETGTENDKLLRIWDYINIAAAQHAARADAPADVCACGHSENWHIPKCVFDIGTSGSCPCTQFTPAPTSPERRSEVSGEQINALRHAAVDAERERIAAELRECFTNDDFEKYIDKLEGKQR